MERSCETPSGNDAVSSGSREIARLAGASAKGWPAAVRGHHRAEGKTGIHSILAHPKHTHTYDLHNKR